MFNLQVDGHLHAVSRLLTIVLPAFMLISMADSAAATTEAKPKRVVRSSGTPPLPRPPAFKPKSTKFFEYWASLYPKYGDRVTAVIYRLWPVCDRVRNGKTKWLDKYTDRALSRDEVLRTYGSGDYAIYLNDASNGGKTICQGLLVDRDGLRDPEYPPHVEVEDLLQDDPANGSYLAYLKQHHLLPTGDPDVAQTDAVRALSETVQSLATQAAAGGNSNVEAKATMAGLEIVQRASQAATEIVKGATERATAVSASSADPLKVVEQVISAAERMRPPDSGTGLKDLLPIIMQGAESHRQAMQLIIDDQRARLDRMEHAAAQVQPPRQRSIVEELEQLQKVKETLAEVLGVSAADNGPEQEPWWVRTMPMWAPVVQTAFTSLANIAHNVIAAKTGGQPAPPPPAEPAPQPEPKQAALPEQSEDEMLGRFLTMIEPHLRDHVEHHDGAAFAEWLIAQYGAQLLKQLQDAGSEQLAQAFGAHAPELWQWLNAQPAWPQFITDFMTYAPAPKPRVVVRRQPQQPA